MSQIVEKMFLVRELWKAVFEKSGGNVWRLKELITDNWLTLPQFKKMSKDVEGVFNKLSNNRSE